MLLKDDKKGLVTIIMKKMKGSSDMSPSFLSEKAERVPMKDGAEQDGDIAYESCCEDMISAFKEGNSKKLASSLRSFITMVMDEQDVERED